MRIAVYCSSRDDLHNDYVTVAQALGEWIGGNGHTLVYGGVKAGLMHTVAQAVSDGGGQIVGVVPERFAHRADPLVQTCIFSTDLGDRKTIMMEQADVFVVLPGGLGTLDEWISTLSQLTVSPDDYRRIIVVNVNGLFNETIAQLSQLDQSSFARGKNITRSVIVTDKTQLINELINTAKDYEK